MQKNEIRAVRKRKALLFLPLLIVPFLTLGFWVLGGGRNSSKNSIKPGGLNTELPEAALKEGPERSKLSFYDAHDKETKELVGQDSAVILKDIDEGLPASTGDQYGFKHMNSDEEEIYSKIESINNQLNRKGFSKEGENKSVQARKNESLLPSENLDRLESMMQGMDQNKEVDPELKELGTMMEKILDIQHPERVKERMLRKVHTQNRDDSGGIISLKRPVRIQHFDNSGITSFSKPGFYTLSYHQADEEMIEAEIGERTKVRNGSIIQLRILQDFYIKDQVVPKGSVLFGTVMLCDNRVEIGVFSVKVQHTVYKTALEAYDLDGLPGIYIKGGKDRNKAVGSLDEMVNKVNLPVPDHSLRGRMADLGIGAMKQLARNQKSEKPVYLRSGYRVFLKLKAL